MARSKKLTTQQEKELKILQGNYEMLVNTKNQAEEKGNAESVGLIEEAIDEVKEQIAAIDETAIPVIKKTRKSKPIPIVKESKSSNIYDRIDSMKSETREEVVKEKNVSKDENVNNVISHNIFETIPSDAQYDVISLPSHGEGYKNKIDRLPVAYLTAYDEDIITSPNLYRDGLVLDYLLQNKVLDKDFNIDDLYSGDADAIILFLRATSYGQDFPVTVRDPKTGENIETVADLTKFQPKEFVLKGDENGFFTFKLPISKDEVKFRFLTRGDEKNLLMLSKLEIKDTQIQLLESAQKVITTAIERNDELDNQTKASISNGMNSLERFIDDLKSTSSVPYSRSITNRLEMNIVSVNGNSDRDFIHQYVKNMRAKDSLELRKYILKNEPGINWEMEVQRPENLGGGSFKTFLEWDDTIFLNIT